MQHHFLVLILPADVCFSFSFFFFRHFHGLKILPSVASLLFLLTGGVRIPETKYSERIAGDCSISSERGREESQLLDKKLQHGLEKGRHMEAHQLTSVQSSHPDKQRKTLKESLCTTEASSQAEPERCPTSLCQPGYTSWLWSSTVPVWMPNTQYPHCCCPSWVNQGC